MSYAFVYYSKEGNDYVKNEVTVDKNVFTSSALIFCSSCGHCISNCCGPKYGVICESCYFERIGDEIINDYYNDH